VILRRELRTALEAADAADAVTMPRFRAADLAVEVKADSTPVSEADKAAEQAIRGVIARDFPGDEILGEEYGEDTRSGRRWIIDPIDATVNYIRGAPVWGTLIALEADGEVVVGVVSSPALGSRWWAARGEGAWRNAARIAVSSVDRIEQAYMSFNALKACFTAGIGDQVMGLIHRCERVLGFGDFWSFMLLAEGAVDLVVEPIAAVWDLAPLQVIVEEAGGTMTDLAGRRAIDAGNAVATNGKLHQEVLAALGR
jgi:histidinol-phosphatase